ncbi:MAG: sporulation transcriptional regulator SpoIIID [Clostridia bacterium]|nr:sporulation transcriptional regulator SpoIIID [Clostridia bacterium]
MYISCCKERCVMLGTYLVENRTTVRATAQQFNISKSTVHKDVTQVLRRVNPALYEQVQRVLEQNKDERHLRGGEATKKKYLYQNIKNNG